MAVNTRVFRSEDTWRRLGYIVHQDSREFRRVLDENPAWDIGVLPAEGDIVFVNSSQFGEPVGQLKSIPLTDFAGANNETQNNFYPWNDLKKLYKRLSKYPQYGLDNPNELNG